MCLLQFFFIWQPCTGQILHSWKAPHISLKTSLGLQSCFKDVLMLDVKQRVTTPALLVEQSSGQWQPQPPIQRCLNESLLPAEPGGVTLDAETHKVKTGIGHRKTSTWHPGVKNWAFLSFKTQHLHTVTLSWVLNKSSHLRITGKCLLEKGRHQQDKTMKAEKFTLCAPVISILKCIITPEQLTATTGRVTFHLFLTGVPVWQQNRDHGIGAEKYAALLNDKGGRQSESRQMQWQVMTEMFSNVCKMLYFE